MFANLHLGTPRAKIKHPISPLVSQQVGVSNMKTWTMVIGCRWHICWLEILQVPGRGKILSLEFCLGQLGRFAKKTRTNTPKFCSIARVDMLLCCYCCCRCCCCCWWWQKGFSYLPNFDQPADPPWSPLLTWQLEEWTAQAGKQLLNDTRPAGIWWHPFHNGTIMSTVIITTISIIMLFIFIFSFICSFIFIIVPVSSSSNCAFIQQEFKARVEVDQGFQMS